jgi:hypothetical protein
MSPLPTDAFAAAEFLVQRLYRPIDLAEDTRFSAVSETERPFAGDIWFWTDDNAKVLEFLARPELGARYAQETGQILRFLRAMCRGPLIFRRVSAPRLELAGQHGTAANYYHSLMHLRFDLPHGYLVAGIRFHDGRTADNLLLCANCVDFTYKGKSHRVNVEKAINSVNVEHNGNELILNHSSDLFFQPRWRTIRLGRITYIYVIDARSMLINVEVVLEVDPAADVADVVLTIGHDHLSHGSDGVEYSQIFTDEPGAPAPRFVAGEPSRGILAAAGVGYYSIVQAEITGFALAIHTVPREPSRLSNIETLVQEQGKLHFARARYRFDGSCRGARLTAGEDKLLTAGGFYHRVNDYVEIMREAISSKSIQKSARDFSLSYDYGAELNGFAHYFNHLVISGSSPKVTYDIKDMFDFYLQVYYNIFVNGHADQKNTVFSRQLAFVILAVVTMYRVTGDEAYCHRLAELCDVMLDFEKCFADIAGNQASGFLMGVHSQRTVFLDCHSAALLALTEAARHLNDSRLAATIDRGLESYCLETTVINWIDGMRKIDVVAVNWLDDNGIRHTNNGFWNFHVGLTLRFFNALRSACDPALQAIARRHRDRIDLLESVMRRQLEKSMTRHADSVEFRCSVFSAETNSETQPWVTLGLLTHSRITETGPGI